MVLIVTFVSNNDSFVMDDLLVSTLRKNDVLHAYHDSMKSLGRIASYTSQETIINNAMKMGAPRFYTTFEKARRFVSLLERDKELPLSNVNKIEMYTEIHRRYQECKNEGCIGYSVLETIISQPAPSFYMNSTTFRDLVYKKLNNK